MSKYAPIWPTPPDDPADVSIEQLEGDVARLEEKLEHALAALHEIAAYRGKVSRPLMMKKIARAAIAEAEE